MQRLWFPIAVFALAGPGLANDVVFLNGRVIMEKGAAPGQSVEIQLSCKGADHPVRQAMTDKGGKFYLKVERDEFNHVARAVPTNSVDLQDGPPAGSCQVIADLTGYTSSAIDLSTFTIGKDLKLPDLVLTPRAVH